jgi:23S rRNA maturation-related 3'-5' exoribonuclease YhaM
MKQSEKVALFKSELKMIRNKDIQDFVKEVFKHIPEHGFTTTASTSMKYHPKDERGHLGNVAHSKKVTRWAHVLAEAFSVTDSLRLDILTASCVLHDLGRRGLGSNPSPHTLRTHASIMTGPLEKAQEKVQLDIRVFNSIKDCVRYHNGKWTEKEIRKPLSEYTRLEMIVHISDMAASRMHLIPSGKELMNE